MRTPPLTPPKYIYVKMDIREKIKMQIQNYKFGVVCYNNNAGVVVGQQRPEMVGVVMRKRD